MSSKRFTKKRENIFNVLELRSDSIRNDNILDKTNRKEPA